VVYIFAGALATVFSRLTSEAGQAKQAMWLYPRLLFRVLTISFIVQKAIVISYVAIVVNRQLMNFLQASLGGKIRRSLARELMSEGIYF
jgi:hypothetical protein